MEYKHHAELAVQGYLQRATAGKATMDKEVIEKIASDVKDALNKQFNSGPREEFRLRMSNIMFLFKMFLQSEFGRRVEITLRALMRFSNASILHS